jgi:uncharacterized protein
MKGRYDTTANASVNTTFDQVLRQHWSCCQVVRGGLVAAGVALLSAPAFPLPGQHTEASTPLFAFQGLPVSQADQVIVPPGYTAQMLYAWGEPISDGPAFKPDASNTAADQMVQAGMSHDGIYFFPLPMGTVFWPSTTNTPMMGCCMSAAWSPGLRRKSQKSQAAHGVSIIEVACAGGKWQVIRPSTYARRITARTPIRACRATTLH